MAAPVRRAATTLSWSAPCGRSCILSPLSGGQGLLEIEIHDDLVAVHSRNCLLHTVSESEEDDYTELAEYEITLSLQRCVITWTQLERTEAGDIERSAYFSQ